MVIGIIFMTCVSLLLFRYAYVQEKMNHVSWEETAADAMEQLEDQIFAAYSLTEKLTKDSRLSRIAYGMYPDDYEKSQIILGILASINDSDNLNASIDGIQLHFPSIRIGLSSESGYNNRDNSIAPGADDLYGSLLIKDKKLMIYSPYPLISTVLNTTPDYYCTVSFSDNYINSVLKMFGDGSRSGALLVFADPSGTVYAADAWADGETNQELLAIISENGLDALKNSIYLGRQRLSVNCSNSQLYPFSLITWRTSTLLSANIVFTVVSLLFVFLLMAGLLFLMIRQTDRDVAKPLYKLMEAFNSVAEGNLGTHIYHNQNDEFDFIYDSFNSMTERTQQLISDITEQHKLLQNAELMELQAQIDPHFLYNSFTIIKYMADGEEYEQITEFVTALAKYYRFINKETRQNIALIDEVKHMQTYMYIQQMRFDERIRVEMTGFSEKYARISVPKLVLQPLVENCYNHGLKNKLRDGIISIEFEQRDRQLYISVSDNGDEMTEELLALLRSRVMQTDDQSVSHALSNIRRRLELAYGDSERLTVSIGKLGGLCVTLHFDLDNLLYD